MMANINKLIQGYKEDFTAKTGKYIKIFTCPKLESQMHISENPNIYAIALLVCRYAGWDFERTIKMKGQKHENVLARQMIAAILRYNNCKLRTISLFLGRDHSTILAQLRAFEGYYQTEPTFKQLYEEIVINLTEHYHDYENITEEEFNKLIKDDTI